MKITQTTRFPDADTSSLSIDGAGRFAIKLRYPGWVGPGAMQVKVNGKVVKVDARPGTYVSLDRAWKKGDRIEVKLPMQTTLEQMPDKSNYYAVLRGPIVLAAKTSPFNDEKLNVFADDSRLGHIANGQVCPLGAAPLLVSDTRDFVKKIKAVPGQPLTFTAPQLIHGKDAGTLRLIPFYRVHDSRYMVYWPYSTSAGVQSTREAIARAEAEQLTLAKQTIDQVAPGEQQPESDHAYAGEATDSGVSQGRHWRQATDWFSYVLNDRKQEAKTLRLTLSRKDAGRKFDVLVNDQLIEPISLDATAATEFYTKDLAIPAELVKAAHGKLTVKFVAKPGSIAGGIYGVRLLRE